MTDHFEKCGLVLGLIAYPFQLEGKELYREVLEKQFFSNYKNGIDKYSLQKLPNHLYDPRGYRLFGNYGLLVVSLIDDFAFCDRIFHANHGYRDTDKNETKYQHSSKVITGISCAKTPAYLENKAKQTFLRKGDDHTEKRYPFIGINKLKINNDLLFGHGCGIIEEIKEKILSLSNSRNNVGDICFDSIIVDSFDNDELVVISFSNNISELDSFFSSVRNLCHPFNGASSASEIPVKKVFLSCYTNIGYDIDYRFDSEPLQGKFIKVKNTDNIKIKLIWETKVGCYDEFKNYIHEVFEGDTCFDSNLTGGKTLSHKANIDQIHKLEDICSNDKNVKKCIRRVKVVLLREEKPDKEKLDPKNKKGKDEGVDSDYDKFENFIFEPKDLREIRELLNACRVGKILRERLLKIYGLFNESLRNSLHAPYLLELHGALSYINKLLKGFRDSPQLEIGHIDEILSETITAFEEAYYNRFHQKDSRDINLEYNGGIQQHITSFDFAYKEILKLLQPENNSEKHKDKHNQQIEEAFLSVSGYERVSSMRMNLRININQITYPELFAISVWKEASNFTYNLLHQSYPGIPKDEANIELIKEVHQSEKIQLTWNRFINNKESLINIGTLLKNQKYYNEDDEVFYILSKIVSKETIEYFFIDAQTFHFGFNRDYPLFYYAYWKYFLQISQYYDRNGKINKEYFIPYLLRLFMVGFRNDYSSEYERIDGISFLKGQRFKPFDPVFSELWLMCYEKVYLFAKTLWEELSKRYFEKVGDDRMAILDLYIVKDDLTFKEKIGKKVTFEILTFYATDERRREIGFMKEKIKQAHLIDYENDINQSKDFIICLFNAYLQGIKELDEGRSVERKIKSVPRHVGGTILLDDELEKNKKRDMNEDPLKKVISNLPSDPLGGIFISNYETRGTYFSYRTSFYRSLWNYTMKKRNLFNTSKTSENE